MANPAQAVADNIQKVVDDLEKRIPDPANKNIRPALEAQLAEQRRQLAYVKKVGG